MKTNKKKNNLIWRKLDNSAKIFPIISSKRYSSVFRLSAILTEKIERDILEKAISLAIQEFPCFKVCLKQGFFWYYFEENAKKIKVEEESNYPCKYIDPNTNNNYLFKVTYFERKINVDIFHSLTDGNSGIHFLKAIVYNYIELSHPQEFSERLRSDRKIEFDLEDDYINNYDKKQKGSRQSNQKAYLLKGRELPFAAIGVVHQMISVEQLKKKAKEKQSTITQYLTAVLIQAIEQAKTQKMNPKKPIKICIPVDLKKYFKSKTINNFFSYITVQIEAKKDAPEKFDTILEMVKKEFQVRLTEEGIKQTMSANVKLGNNVAIRMIPLFLKNIVVRLSYLEIRKYTTTTFSNVGRIGIIGEYKKYIENFLIMIAPESVEKIKCSSCSYEDNLIFTFTSTLKEQEVEKSFFRILQEQGIEVKIESNGVRDVIS